MPTGSSLRPEDYQDELGNDITLIDAWLAKTPAERIADWEDQANWIAQWRTRSVPTESPVDQPEPPRR